MVDLYYTINGNKLYSKQGLYKVIGNTANKYICHFDFQTDEWNGFTSRLAVFKSASFNIVKTVVIGSDNTCVVPWEITCKPGIVICSVSGLSDTDKVVTNPVHVLLSHDFASDDYDYSDSPTPSEFVQFVKLIKANMDEYYASRQYSYDMLIDHPSIEGVDLEGEMTIESFGFEVASVLDIDNMFD